MVVNNHNSLRSADGITQEGVDAAFAMLGDGNFLGITQLEKAALADPSVLDGLKDTSGRPLTLSEIQNASPPGMAHIFDRDRSGTDALLGETSGSVDRLLSDN